MGRMVDGVQSLYTDLGSKSGAVSYSSRLVPDKQLMSAYTSSWIVSKYVDKTARDMLKKPREFSGSYEQSVLDQVLKKSIFRYSNHAEYGLLPSLIASYSFIFFGVNLKVSPQSPLRIISSIIICTAEILVTSQYLSLAVSSLSYEV